MYFDVQELRYYTSHCSSSSLVQVMKAWHAGYDSGLELSFSWLVIDLKTWAWFPFYLPRFTSSVDFLGFFLFDVIGA